MTMERRIPHVRDVFSDLRSYDHSPRSRRKETSTPPPSSRRQHQNQQPAGVTGGVAPPTQPLTERDFRHLERHLSMKKTIRKQISRNLAQAFVEDPKVFSNNAVNHANHGRQQPQQHQPAPQPQVITLTRAKIARSDQNFLDMLKEPQHRATAEESRVAAESCSSNQPSFWKFLGLKGKSKR